MDTSRSKSGPNPLHLPLELVSLGGSSVFRLAAGCGHTVCSPPPNYIVWLFLWPLEGTADMKVDGETLDEALIRINADISSLPRLTNFPRAGPCLAEYSDGKFYRARLVKFTSVEPVTILVQHVDFGSDDTLPTSKLRQMPTELLQFPSRALKVKVAGFKAPSVNRQEAVLPYSPGWSVKAAMDMIDLLHNNITASVVAKEPELTVLLYNEDGDLVHLPLVSSGLAELQ